MLMIYAFRQTVIANKALVRGEHLRYAADMNLAQATYDTTTPNMSRLQSLLAEYKDSSLRGFEWGYLNRLIHLDLMTMRGEVSSAAFSPNGLIVATGGPNRVTIWNRKTGKSLRFPREGRRGINCRWTSVRMVSISSAGVAMVEQKYGR